MSSRVGGDRRWNELAILLEAGKAIIREPDPEKCQVESRTGDALGQDVRKLTTKDIERLKNWFNFIEPGLYDRFENDSDQLKILDDTRQSEPRLPALCSTMIPYSLAFQDHQIRAPRSRRRGPKRQS